MAKGHDGAVMRTTLSVTLIIFISKAVGFLRDAILANYFGTSAQNSAYTAAYGLLYFPILLFSSCITSTLTPMFLDTERKEGQGAANLFGSNAINVFALTSLVIGLLMYVLTEPIVNLLYYGSSPEMKRMIIDLTRIMLPSLMFVVISIVQSTIMNAKEKFVAGQLTGFPYSILTIIAAMFFSAPYGIKAVAWATALAGLMQILIIVPFQRSVFSYSPRLNFKDARIKRLLYLAAPSMASMAVNEINHQIDSSMASVFDDSTFSAMGFAFRIITFIIGIVVVPIITVMFNKMSKHAIDKNHKAVSNILMQCVEVIALILLPIVAILGVLNQDVIKLAFMRGEFDARSLQITASIFLMYLLGTVFFGLRDLFNRGFHSIQNTKVPLYVAIVSMVINVGLNNVLSRAMGARGLALATSISSLIGVIMLFLILRKKLGSLGTIETPIELLKTLTASILCLFCALILNRYVPEATGTMRVFFRLVLCSLPSLLVYISAMFLLKARQLTFLKSIIKR